MSWTAIEFDFGRTEDVEIAAALLQLHGFAYFEEKEQRLVAYWDEQEDALPPQNTLRAGLSSLSLEAIRLEKLEDRNWNEEWERNYPPVAIDDFCRIRAPFHDRLSGFDYELEVRPAMAFGTGHHATTSNVIRLMRELDFHAAHVLDMGCGTGVLGILAEKRGAQKVVLADNFDWACASTEENAERNACTKCEVIHGGPEALGQEHVNFDVILANINRNVLLEQISTYHTLGTKNCDLLMSGFYEEDAHLIEAEAAKYRWRVARSVVEKRWKAIHFTRT